MSREDISNFILVTGASRGIGRGAAISLAALGFDLVLWARSGEDLEQTAAECVRYGRRVISASVDVSSCESVTLEGGRSIADLGTLRGLVLNAGIGIWNRLEDATTAEWRQMVSTNLDGAFYTLKLTVPLLTRHPNAQIVAIASDSANYAYPGRVGYCASKWGMRGLVEAVRREVRPKGVRVTQIMPSRVDTYFRGKKPGNRPDSLSTSEVGQLVATVFELPTRVEVREMPVSAITASYGPFEECSAAIAQ